MKFDGAVIDFIQTFTVPQITEKEKVNEKFHKYSTYRTLHELLQNCYSGSSNHTFNEFFRDLSSLHISTTNPWNLILRKWEDIEKEYEIKPVPLIPLRVTSQRSIRCRVNFPDGQEEVRGKVQVDWFAPFVFSIRQHFDIRKAVEYTEVIDFILEKNIDAVYYKSYQFSNLKDFSVFVKRKIIESLFLTDQPANKIRLSKPHFSVYLKGTEPFTKGNSKLLAAITLKKKRLDQLSRYTLKKIMENSLEFHEKEFIFTSPDGVYVYSPQFNSEAKKAVRKEFRKKITYGLILSAVVSEFLAKSAVIANSIIMNNIADFQYLLTNLATYYNPYMLVGEKTQIVLLDPAPLRKVFKRITTHKRLFITYETTIKSFLHIASNVVIPSNIEVVIKLNSIQPPVVIDNYYELYHGLEKSLLIDISLNKFLSLFDKGLSDSAEKIITYLINKLINDFKTRKARGDLFGCERVSRLLEKLKDEGVNKSNFYKKNKRPGIVGILKLANLIKIEERDVSGRGGPAKFICLNLRHPLIEYIINQKINKKVEEEI